MKKRDFSVRHPWDSTPLPRGGSAGRQFKVIKVLSPRKETKLRPFLCSRFARAKGRLFIIGRFFFAQSGHSWASPSPPSQKVYLYSVSSQADIPCCRSAASQLQGSLAKGPGAPESSGGSLKEEIKQSVSVCLCAPRAMHMEV